MSLFQKTATLIKINRFDFSPPNRYNFLFSTHTIEESNNSDVSVFWNAPFLSGGGYSSEALSLVKATHEKGFDVHIQQHGDAINQVYVGGLATKDRTLLWELINKSKRNRSSITIEVCHSEPGAWKPAAYSTSDCPHFSKKKSYHVGRTMFETDRIPAGWANKMNKMDEIWVPSSFMKDIFEKGGVTNIRVIGESVDTTFFTPIPSVRYGSNLSPEQDPANQLVVSREKFIQDFMTPHPHYQISVDVFLSIFKWEMRKGWDILLEVYFHSFTIHDEVSLLIITQEYHDTLSIKDQINQYITNHIPEKEQSLLPHYSLLTDYVPGAYLPLVYNIASAVVLPTRGEGWGRVAQEAMSCGVPVIVTGYGGCMTFVNSNNAYPISVQGYNEIREGAFVGHLLVEPNHDELAEYMKHVLRDRKDAQKRARQARIDMVEQYSEDAFGRILEKEFHRIQGVLLKRRQEEIDL